MKPILSREVLERLSFIVWIAFTIASISTAGVGLEGVLTAGYFVDASFHVHSYLTLTMLGGFGSVLALLWRQVGIDYLHYQVYDSSPLTHANDEALSNVLHELIREVEESEGLKRTEARVKAKKWLLEHVSELDPNEIQMAKAYLGYLLPAGWGTR